MFQTQYCPSYSLDTASFLAKIHLAMFPAIYVIIKLFFKWILRLTASDPYFFSVFCAIKLRFLIQYETGKPKKLRSSLLRLGQNLYISIFFLASDFTTRDRVAWRNHHELCNVIAFFVQVSLASVVHLASVLRVLPQGNKQCFTIRVWIRRTKGFNSASP